MKKVVLILALVVTAGASVYAFDKAKGRKARKEAEKKEMKCCDKEMAKECKKEGKSCCEKKAE
ncbi:hypothetical protein [Emticicia sp. SJ17W-69]|uniref:hypothetical protein n=1 Tax=Emticicia sp. SJ17W-69 TaxID=3421657 RepID=UPI003EC0BC40